MISNQILQNIIDGVKGISRVDICVMDTEGKSVASTLNKNDDLEAAVATFIGSPAESQSLQNTHFFKVFDDHQLEYILVVKGDSDDVYMVGRMVTFQIQSLIVAYKERYDKDNFIKNLLLDNLLLVDIYNRAKKLHIDVETKRVVFIVETSVEKDNMALETVRTLFSGTKSKDFITAVDEKNIIIVKELRPNDTYEDLEKTGKVVLDMLNTEAMSKVRVSYGTIVNELKDVSRSYKEAKMALDVGRIFYTERNIIAYSNLGIGRLIYQLPMPLCKMFIREIFDGQMPGDFDDETIVTINKFFENNLNVSETSRQLYIHRNTLVYRLDKIQKMTNLDLRTFEDAITFKMALMVVKYMDYVENSDYRCSWRLRERYKKTTGINYCEVCGLTEWQGKPIPLEIHHLNGKNTDNRLENLQLLCPNCHALTSNYRGRAQLSALSEKRDVECRKFKETITGKADGNLEPSL